MREHEPAAARIRGLARKWDFTDTMAIHPVSWRSRHGCRPEDHAVADWVLSSMEISIYDDDVAGSLAGYLPGQVSGVYGLRTALFSCPPPSVLRKCLLKVRLFPVPVVIIVPPLCHSSSLDLDPRCPALPISAARFPPTTKRVPCSVQVATH